MLTACPQRLRSFAQTFVVTQQNATEAVIAGAGIGGAPAEIDKAHQQ